MTVAPPRRPRSLTARFSGVVETLGSYGILNLLWLASVALVITALPGTVAVVRVLRQWDRQGHADPYPWRAFLVELRDTWAQALRTGGVLVVLSIGLVLVSTAVAALPDSIRPVAWLLIGLCGVALAGLWVFWAPVLTDFDSPDRVMLRNALILAGTHPIVVVTSTALALAAVVVTVSAPVAVLVLPAPCLALTYRLCHGALRRSVRRAKGSAEPFEK
jgi:uncharacterized membrane protein YesL